MMIKHPETKLTNYSEKVDDYLNRIYLLREVEVDFEHLVDLLENIEGWRTCIDEIELSVKSNHVFNTLKNNEHEIDDETKEIIIY